MEKVMKLRQTIQKAELEAKRRLEIDLCTVNMEEAKANEQGFMIVRKNRSLQTRLGFLKPLI